MKLELQDLNIQLPHAVLFQKKCDLTGLTLIQGENGIGKTQWLDQLILTIPTPSLVFQKKLTPLNQTSLSNELHFLEKHFCSLFQESRSQQAINLFKTQFLHAPINLLSAGENQIAKIIISLSLDVDWYLWDEPFQNLSKENEQILIELMEVLKVEGKGIVIIDHGSRNIPSDIKVTLSRSERGIEWN